MNLRKLLILTEEQTPSELRKYVVSKEDIISGQIEQLLKFGRFILVNIDSLNIVLTQTLLLYMAKYRYKFYTMSELENNFFIKLIPEGLINFIDNIDDVEDKIIDISKYRLIVHIGDIHGCFDVLMEAWNKQYSGDSLYIFLGDFIDRGTKSVEVVKFLSSISNLNNVIFIEGNHDTNLWYWSMGFNEYLAKSFQKTKIELEEMNIDKEEIKRFCLNFKESLIYKYYDNTILVSHGGLTDFPEKRYLIDSNQYISSQCNDYIDLDTIFSNNVKDNSIYQIHGHNNFFNKKSNFSNQSINLEGGVEFGGSLRIATLSSTGFKFYYYKNKDSVMKNFFINK